MHLLLFTETDTGTRNTQTLAHTFIWICAYTLTHTNTHVYMFAPTRTLITNTYKCISYYVFNGGKSLHKKIRLLTRNCQFILLTVTSVAGLRDVS